MAMDLKTLFTNPALTSSLLILFKNNNHLGANAEVCTFSATILTEEGEEIKFTNELFIVNNIFHLDAVWQVECYLIRRFKAAKFLAETTVGRVSSKKLQGHK